ncbi:Poly-beta-1,6-N-acetyl-D-glucosamine synthase [Moorella thermoacetica]|uniref:Poly-beta-1,6-N-acetyl-D-glucosamine synthase n=1 Tax=Neomoorella thermoacetica TaxID=1525 RepID=A0AAC9HG31_NEOTH|nr:glycosyltransferase family 2 protein [Moorella thermoacetica]AOQ23155.1 Poly-beta-1,6-N-acetyl-D-glucosamine synthase [Moorella thermoacetica]TYL12862.1 Poly-beta-1,6-N-acetyl-D-glucosamine synthase [Moorella thermoacetica]
MTWRMLAEALSYFVFLYPLVMSAVWITGGLYFWWRRERRPGEEKNRWPEKWPPVTVLVPCHNEEVTIAATCENLRRLDYPDYRVLFVDDASADRTAEIIRDYVAAVPYFHLLRLEENRGKAGALNAALGLVETPLVMVQDADTRLGADALKWLAAAFTRQPRLGAVTGNPIVMNRQGFWGKFQAVEFASIIGLIKRSQRVLGRVLTVSGCATIYRTEVLKKVGGFSTATATEDIDVTWRIQRAFYEVWFEPRARAFIQAPARLSQLWKQRKRWTLGGWHLLRSHWDVFKDWRWRRLWPVYADFVMGCVWAFCFVVAGVVWAVSLLFGLPPHGLSPLPAWHGAVASVVCVAQMAAAVAINNRYDPGLIRCLFWMPWYPLIFFAVEAVLVVWTAPRGLFGSMERAGKWQSPARETCRSFSDIAA